MCLELDLQGHPTEYAGTTICHPGVDSHDNRVLVNKKWVLVDRFVSLISNLAQRSGAEVYSRTIKRVPLCNKLGVLPEGGESA